MDATHTHQLKQGREAVQLVDIPKPASDEYCHGHNEIKPSGMQRSQQSCNRETKDEIQANRKQSRNRACSKPTPPIHNLAGLASNDPQQNDIEKYIVYEIPNHSRYALQMESLMLRRDAAHAPGGRSLLVRHAERPERPERSSCPTSERCSS